MSAATAITNVRVFDGERPGELTTVMIDDGVIVASRPEDGGSSGDVVDGGGGTLLPGLIDTHVHADKMSQLEASASWGITTMLDMGNKDLANLETLKQRPGLPTLKSAGNPASAPNSVFVRKMGFAVSTTVTGPGDAARFVAERLAEGSDYIKILVEDPEIPGTKALGGETVAALVVAAHAAGLTTVAHVVSADTMATAVRAGADVVTHTALTSDLSPEFDALLAGRSVVLIPTLTMMQGVVHAIGGRFAMRVLAPFVPAVRLNYRHAKSTVATFHRAGVVILAGTDANDDLTAPYQVAHGESLHEELERLVDAGLTPSEALRGATSLAAGTFGLTDRGVIAPGRRADLVLVDGDPTRDISATRNIPRRVDRWVPGQVAGTSTPTRSLRASRASLRAQAGRSDMILVTAAHGNQGKLLVPKLLAAGQPVRACVQSHASAERLHALGVQEVVVGDICEPAVLARAIRGVEEIYHVGPTAHPRERAMGFAVVDAAKAAGVRHLVFSSVLHAITTDLVQHEVKRDIEEHLLSSGLEFTILQPANYMLPLKLRPVFEQGVFELSWSLERRQSLVDLDDVTDVACMVLIDSERHAGATYELAAPGRYTAHELGAIIARVLGRPIEVREIDADTYLKAWVGDADPQQLTHQLGVLRGITARYSSHDFVGNPNVLTWLLGRSPATFEAYVRRQQESFLRKGGP